MDQTLPLWSAPEFKRTCNATGQSGFCSILMWTQQLCVREITKNQNESERGASDGGVSNRGQRDRLPERRRLQSIIPQTKMAASSCGPFVLRDHLLLCCANNLMCIWRSGAPGNRKASSNFSWLQSSGRSCSPAALWLGTAIEKGQLASCRSGCKLTGEIWSRGLPEEKRMLGEMANAAQALLAGKTRAGRRNAWR